MTWRQVIRIMLLWGSLKMTLVELFSSWPGFIVSLVQNKGLHWDGRGWIHNLCVLEIHSSFKGVAKPVRFFCQKPEPAVSG